MTNLAAWDSQNVIFCNVIQMYFIRLSAWNTCALHASLKTRIKIESVWYTWLSKIRKTYFWSIQNHLSDLSHLLWWTWLRETLANDFFNCSEFKLTHLLFIYNFSNYRNAFYHTWLNKFLQRHVFNYQDSFLQTWLHETLYTISGSIVKIYFCRLYCTRH